MKAGWPNMRGMAWVGIWIVLAATVGRAQMEPAEPPEEEDVPAVAAPMPGMGAAPPAAPFTPPLPTPLPPEQAGPFSPPIPVAVAEGQEPPVPMVRLHVRAPARTEANKEIEYRLTVQNISRADAHHVQVRDRLPRGVDKPVRAEPAPTRQTKSKDDVTDLLWELGTLKAGQAKEIVLSIKPQGNQDVENRAYVQFEHGQKVLTRIAKPSVQAKVTAPPQVTLYESIPFRIEITNTGAVPLRNVVVTDELPSGLELVEGKPEPNGEKPLTWKLGDIGPRQTRRLECQVISKQAGTFRNSVKVAAEGSVSTTNSAAVVVGETKLKISTSGPQRRLANREIPYHITVRNLGTMPVTNVQVSDELPRGIEFVRASTGGRKEGGFVRWSLGTLPAGERRSLLLVVRAPESGWCWNEATVRAENNLSDKARSEATRIEAAKAPVVEIEKNYDVLDMGQKASYTVRLFNPGTTGLLNPSVVVSVPEELSIKGERGESTGKREGQLVRFSPLQVLEGGRVASYVLEVEAKKAGEARLRAWWTDGRQEKAAPETWEDKTVILESARPASGVASAPRETSSGR